MSAQGIIHLLADQAPTMGMLASTTPVSVVHRSCRPNKESGGVGPAPADRLARPASHCGDSGTARSTTIPSKAGSPASRKSHCQESGVIGQIRPHCDRSRMPTLMPAAMTPETVALLAVGQLSATRAIPLGQTPPMPSPTRNRSTSICSCVVTKAPAAAQSE